MALSVVYPADGSQTTSTVDIVAVHGLGGDAIETWTHSKSGKFWLKDFLPEQISDARILTFGYNATAAFGQSTADVIDHAKSLLGSLIDKRDEKEKKERPLIFLAHSLGGIVVKQALLQARLDSRYQSVLDSTIGIVFFGTPHRGSEKASYGKVLANVAQTVSRRPPSRLLKALQTNSDVLLRLTSDFRFQLPQYHVVSFYETKPMSIFSSLIVEKHSALLEVVNEEQLPVDANHSAICKFETSNSDTFEKVYKRIQRMLQAPRPAKQDEATTFNKHFEVPHLLSPVFTGHESICQTLQNSLSPTSKARKRFQHRFVLYGLGGSGKTQICLRYIQEFRERYWGIFWIDASTDENIKQSMIGIARLLQVNQDVASVKCVLANTSRPWLLVFDNVDDPDLQLSPYFPTGDHGDIIITSRNPDCRTYNTVGVREVGPLLPKDAISLLQMTINSGQERSDVHDEERDAQILVNILGRLALAISQAGACIRETSYSVHNYLELYQLRRDQMLRFAPKHSATDYSYTVYTTWQVSIDKLQSMTDVHAEYALQLLKLLCFYHHDQVPIEMFYNAWVKTKLRKVHPSWALWPETMSKLVDLRQSIQTSVSLLISFSLIHQDFNMSLSLHPLVYDWCRDSLAPTMPEINCQQAVSMLATSVRWNFETEDYSFRRLLTAHVQSCLRFYNPTDHELDEKAVDECEMMTLVLRENGLSRDALQLIEQTLAARMNKLGEDHPDTLRSMYSLAASYSEVGRREEALQLYERVVAFQKVKLGKDHSDTLGSMGNLAGSYSEAGRTDEALQLSERVVALRKIKLGEDHPDTLGSINNLAILYGKVGRQDEALQLSERVVALWKIKLGEEHPNTLLSINNLANRYKGVGRHDEALQLSEQVVALRKIKLGKEHPDTLTSINNLAICYGEVGRHDEALQLSEQVVALQKIRLGEDHPDTLRSIHNLAILYSKVGRQDEALQLSEQMVALQKIKLGEDHPDTLLSMHNLAVSYIEVGRQEEAVRMTEHVVLMRTEKLGEDHPDTVNSIHLLRFIRKEIDRSSQPKEVLDRWKRGITRFWQHSRS